MGSPRGTGSESLQGTETDLPLPVLRGAPAGEAFPGEGSASRGGGQGGRNALHSILVLIKKNLNWDPRPLEQKRYLTSHFRRGQALCTREALSLLLGPRLSPSLHPSSRTNAFFPTILCREPPCGLARFPVIFLLSYS